MGYYINTDSVKPIPEKIKSFIDNHVARHNHILYGSSDDDYINSGFEKFNPECLYNADTVVFHRHHAVGDILMAVPVIRQMKKYYNIRRVIYEYGETRHVIQPEMFPDLECMTTYNGKYDYYIDGENGLLEQDHDVNLGLTDVPRMSLYQRFLGLPEDTDLDYSFAEDTSKMQFDIDKDNIAYLALYTGTNVRRIVQSFIPYLSKYLNFIGYKVLFADNMQPIKNIDAIYAYGTTNVQQAITNMKHSKICISVDTGSLWFSHFAKVPTIVLAGSTSKEVRMTYHPMRKSGQAFGIDMRKYCGCDKHCGGTGIYCGKLAPCMNEFPYGKLLEDIAILIDKIRKVEK